MTVLFIILFWGLVLVAFFRPWPMLLFVFFGSMSFETFAVLPPQVTGGLTLTPTPIVALLIVVRTFGSADGLRRLISLAFRLERLALLFAFWIVAVYATLFMPRLLANAVDVVPVRGSDLSSTAPLLPTAQNISQLGYLTISVFTVFAFTDLLRDPATRRHSINGLVFGGVMVVVTGLLDFASQYLPISPLLAPLRTASYSLATEVIVLGGKRVVGLTSEASAFGGLAVSFLMLLYFLRRTIDNATMREIVVPIILFCLVALVYEAKSSGAYVGLALFLGIAAAEWLWRFFSRRWGARTGVLAEFWVIYLLALAVLFAALLKPDILNSGIELVNRMVFEKASSASYDERGIWRSTAWGAFWSSYGAGVGVGSTRSSSEIAGIFAATGLLGGLLYYCFVAQTMLRRAKSGDLVGQQVANAVRLAFLPAFVVSYFVGSADFGAFHGFMYGLVTGTAFALFPSVPDRPAAKRSERRGFEGRRTQALGRVRPIP